MAGEGELTMEVRKSDGTKLPVTVERLTSTAHEYSCTFIPSTAGPHLILLKYNGYPITSGPISLDVKEGDYATVAETSTTAAAAEEDEAYTAQIDQISRFVIEIAEHTRSDDVLVNVSSADGETVACVVRRETVTRFVVEFVPRRVGAHAVAVTVDGDHLDGSPFSVQALDLSAVKVLGFDGGALGQPLRFKVDTSSAGTPKVDVNLTVNGEAVECQLSNLDGAGGHTLVTAKPTKAGTALLNVSVGGLLLPECPYEAIIVDDRRSSLSPSGTALNSSIVNRRNEFFVNLESPGQGELDVVIKDPKGGAVPVQCFQQKNGTFRVEFTPKLVGPHEIDVTFANDQVEGSPFISEAIDLSQVRFGGESRRFSLREEVVIPLTRGAAGKGALEVRVVDATGKPVSHDVGVSAGGEQTIRFMPLTAGEHQINVTFAGVPVQGSPLRVLVEEAGRPNAHGTGLQRAIAHQQAVFTFDSKKTKGGLKVEIIGPNSKAKHTSSKKSEGVYEIVFTPIEAGFHTVNVLFNNKPIYGSPYSVPVIDPAKVRSNLQTMQDEVIPINLDDEIRVNIDAVDAGPGKLTAFLHGPDGSQVDCKVDELGYGKYQVQFTPESIGEHELSVLWDDLPTAVSARFVTDSQPPPKQLVAAEIERVVEEERQETTTATAAANEEEEDRSGDHLNVVLRGEGLRSARTKEETEFIIDGSDAANGEPRCSILGQKADIPVNINHLGNNVFQATYTPLFAGSYTLEVLWEDKAVRGSPFKINVQAAGEASQILIATEYLKMGIIGQELKTTIDTRMAGPGNLTAQCIGPNKLAYCALYDHKDDTYTLCIRPNEIGKHTLVVKYNEEHVEGSPFAVHVSNPPKPERVRVFGPGVEHGILSRFKSNFFVDTKGAGAGHLTVRVRGPKGAFNVEMQRERKQERTISCKYEPREPGDYQIEVKWAGEHVPGSPFVVLIFDTEQELGRFLNGEPPSPASPLPPFLPPGWVGPPPPGVFGPPPPHQHMLTPPPHHHPGGSVPPPFPPPMAIGYASSTMQSGRSGRYVQNGY